MEDFARSIMYDDEEYIRETGVINRTKSTLKVVAETRTNLMFDCLFSCFY